MLDPTIEQAEITRKRTTTHQKVTITHTPARKAPKDLSGNLGL